jgi:hypothetical protein
VIMSCFNNFIHKGPTCVEIQSVEMSAIIGGLCCVDFINPIGVVAGVWRRRVALFVGPFEKVSSEDGGRIRSPECRGFK